MDFVNGVASIEVIINDGPGIAGIWSFHAPLNCLRPRLSDTWGRIS